MQVQYTLLGEGVTENENFAAIFYKNGPKGGRQAHRQERRTAILFVRGMHALMSWRKLTLEGDSSHVLMATFVLLFFSCFSPYSQPPCVHAYVVK